MDWYVWAAIVVAILLFIRARLIYRLGRAEGADRDYFVILAIGVMCVIAGLGIVLAVSLQVFSL